jgi:hypothetical protein
MLSTRSQDALSDTLSTGSEGRSLLVEWMVENEWFVDGNTCFLLIIFLAMWADDVRGRAMKDTFPPKLPSISLSDLENEYEKIFVNNIISINLQNIYNSLFIHKVT